MGDGGRHQPAAGPLRKFPDCSFERSWQHELPSICRVQVRDLRCGYGCGSRASPGIDCASVGRRSYRPGPTITRSSSSGATFGRKDALARSGIVPAAKNVGMARASDARRSKGDESTSGTGAAREVAGIPDPPRTAKARANAPGPARARSPVRSKSVRQAVISEITKIQEDQPPDAPGKPEQPRP